MPDAALMQSLSHSARHEVAKVAVAVRQRDDLTKRQRRDLLHREVEMIAARDERRRQDTRPPQPLTQTVEELVTAR